MSEPEEFEPDLVTAVRRLLAERGPMTEAALAEALDDGDADAFGEELSGAADDTPGWPADGRWADALSPVEGRVVTHRLAADEVAHEVLHVQPDLALVRAMPDAARYLPSGEPLAVVFPELPEPGVREVPDEAGHPAARSCCRSAHSPLDARPGDLVSLATWSAPVVPAGDTMQIFGGIEPVRVEERDELLALLDTEPEADELVALLTRRFAPPTMALGLP